jgi:hypothetical protein
MRRIPQQQLIKSPLFLPKNRHPQLPRPIPLPELQPKTMLRRLHPTRRPMHPYPTSHRHRLIQTKALKPHNRRPLPIFARFPWSHLNPLLTPKTTWDHGDRNDWHLSLLQLFGLRNRAAPLFLQPTNKNENSKVVRCRAIRIILQNVKVNLQRTKFNI